MRSLRARGKRLVVLTNAASYTRTQLLEKYHRLGFDFSADEVVSSRDAAAARLQTVAPGATWAAISAEGDSFADIRPVWKMPSPGPRRWTGPMPSCSCRPRAGPRPGNGGCARR
ncbi:MAG: hypothetical protein R3D63_10535 [Paracoccaceae bacterium]